MNVIIDTETSKNKLHDVKNSLVKYMIMDEFNCIIDIPTSIYKEIGS